MTTNYIETTPGGQTIELRCGRWEDVLADVGECDAVICDPPYGAKTHEGHNASTTGHTGLNGDGANRAALDYDAWGPGDVTRFVDAWTPRCRGWMVGMTSHDLIPHWISAYESAGRYAFAPVILIQHRPRLGGDGPGSCAIYVMVSRPGTAEYAAGGSLPGWYKGAPVRGAGVIGAKPERFVRALVRDYTRPGDLIVDPFAGSGTTLIAARSEGRSCIGAEMDPETFDKAVKRLEKPYTESLSQKATGPKPKNEEMF
ncbi:MAG TPA: site-specific DNA-methyltransferase [Actinobacteria bacterium]|nr:site-specific DNA-methyltransferase [Actinomycetota bacterium]